MLLHTCAVFAYTILLQFFKENDYFENTVLTKEFMIDPNSSEPASQGTEIKWKPGKVRTYVMSADAPTHRGVVCVMDLLTVVWCV